MNNYTNYPTYNYNPNSVSNTPNQQVNYNNNNLFQPYEGFIRGNMFPSLYDQYNQNRPYQIRPNNEQADMLTYIDSLTFAMIDLGLYLDVNPDDQKTINLFNQYRVENNKMMEQYQNKYGPLVLSSDSLNSYPWAWDNKPWPWEN